MAKTIWQCAEVVKSLPFVGVIAGRADFRKLSPTANATQPIRAAIRKVARERIENSWGRCEEWELSVAELLAVARRMGAETAMASALLEDNQRKRGQKTQKVNGFSHTSSLLTIRRGASGGVIWPSWRRTCGSWQGDCRGHGGSSWSEREIQSQHIDARDHRECPGWVGRCIG